MVAALQFLSLTDLESWRYTDSEFPCFASWCLLHLQAAYNKLKTLDRNGRATAIAFVGGATTPWSRPHPYSLTLVPRGRSVMSRIPTGLDSL